MQSITNFLPRVIRWFRRRRSASTPEPPTEVGQAPLSVLAALPLSALPPFVRESEEARDCLALLGALDWMAELVNLELEWLNSPIGIGD